MPNNAVRLVVKLLVASLSVSVVFAVLTLVFLPSDITTWTRSVLVLLVAMLYVRIARQLLAGVAGAYRRVRILSALGFVAVAWLLVSGAYPGWLRGVQVVQLALLGALIVAVNRRVVREAFPRVPDTRPRNRRAALLLVVLVPLVAELSMGNIPLSMLWVLPIFAPIYSGGALLIREVVRRTGGGLANMLILGVAYGLVEEGLVLQGLTSHHLYGAAEWAPRILGVNSAYTVLNLVYHPVFSIVVPIVLVEHFFGRGLYLRRGGVIASGVVAVLGALVLRVAVPPTEDPGYTVPMVAAVVIAVLAVVVIVAGLRVRVPRGRVLTPPRVPVAAGIAGVTTFGFFMLLWPLGDAKHSLFTDGGFWALVAVIAALALVAAAAYVLRRWSVAWTPGHLFGVAIGALVGHTLFAVVGNADTWADRATLLGIAAVTVAAGFTRRRATPESADVSPTTPAATSR
ncbi:hypothetical protein [Cryptosporangium sp. NPDC048952]|uniref:hypothetical protein n=1 Tax=Cryptosporangium sp. NPDC048952 TaxID=3363961 RepID=UPI0037216ACD